MVPGSTSALYSVPSQEGNVLVKNAQGGLAQGFSMVEVFVTITIIGITTAIALVAFTNQLPTIRADAAMQLMEAQLRQARETAVDQRDNIVVTFQGTGEMITVEDLKNSNAATYTIIGTKTLSDFILDPRQMTYMLFAGLPDTPDGFGNLTAVSFNCGNPPLPCNITFQSDGSVVDRTGAYVNGTVFIGNSGDTVTARAITILGATGRIKGYRYKTNAWF